VYYRLELTNPYGTGAGDAFIGALCFWILHSRPTGGITNALPFCSYVAAQKCATDGNDVYDCVPDLTNIPLALRKDLLINQ